jgi:CzcA family heavy metal efflux pump
MDAVIRWSLRNRLLVVASALLLTAYGTLVAFRMPVDVFPDLTAPTVTVVTEAHGMAPEEVESLVTRPIESAMNGAPGVRRVRSASGIGIAVVWVEFAWDQDIYIARQVVAEKLQLVAAQMPEGVLPPVLGPIASIMGEILFLAVRSDRHTPMDLRDAAEWVVRKRLIAIPGVAQVVPIGGELKQLQVLVAPEKLRAFGISMSEVVQALKESNRSTSGGFLVRGAQESLIRALGRVNSKEDVERTVVTVRDGVPILVNQLATVQIGSGIKRGEGSAGGKPAVVVSVQKQPGANTLSLTRAIDQELDAIEKTLPVGMTIERRLFRQADFIALAVENVSDALRDGALFVGIILFLFLLNVRTTLVSLAALPVSLIVAILAMRAVDATINTMTLGGLTIAIGALVDDAIIDVENVFRRLRENRALPEEQRQSALDVIYEASREVRHSIVFATLIVMLVFVPLLVLSGVEGRLLRPLGLAYLVAIFASMVVALTLTPALCAYSLPRAQALERDESVVVTRLKSFYRPLLTRAVARPRLVIGAAVGLTAVALALLPFFGRSFLPDFNEGSLTINIVTLPGTSLEASNQLGRRAEHSLLRFPEVVSTARRTGRAELDEHAQDVFASELEVSLEMRERSKDELLAAIRRELANLPGAAVTIGQPISHRIDHMLSGTRANLAVKVFGEDLAELRGTAERIRQAIEGVEGLVDLTIEQPAHLPELVVAFDREKIARYGLRRGALAEALESAFVGHPVSEILDRGRTYPLVVRYGGGSQADLEAVRNTLLDTPVGGQVPLRMLADIRPDMGPSLISRENVQRKLVVMANVAGRDMSSVVEDCQAAIARAVKLAPGQHLEYGGQFESAEAASSSLAILGALVVLGIFLLLNVAFRSVRRALLIMANLPLALVGGVLALFLTGGVLNVAALVGFITLFGIATRNGIMMVSHFEHLQSVEGATFDQAVQRGALERLSPILMTALCAALALVPLVLAGNQPGNEIQAPMGVVILGGLLTSTGLNMLVIPALYAFTCRPPAAKEA